MKLKILSISPTYFPASRFGGPITALRSLNKYLAKNDVEIEIVTTTTGIDEFKNKYTFKQIDNLPVHYFPTNKIFDIFSNTGWQFSIMLTYFLLKNSRKYDIIYCRSLWNYPTLISFFCSIIYKKPLIIASTGKLTPWAFSQKSRKKFFFWNLLYKNIVKRSYIHYVSNLERSLSEENISIKNNGITINTGTEKTRKENRETSRNLTFSAKNQKTKKILFLGRVHKMKGIDILIKSFSELVKEGLDVSLIISGPYEGNYYKNLHNLISELGLRFAEIPLENFQIQNISRKVIFTGIIDGEDKNWILKNTSVYCQFSRNEGFSNSIIEALSFGKPIVITRGCYFENEDNMPFIKIINDYKQGAEEIKKFVDCDESILEQQQKSILEYSQRYDWDFIAKKAIKDLKNLT